MTQHSDPIDPIIAAYVADQRDRALRALIRDVVIGIAAAAVVWDWWLG